MPDRPVTSRLERALRYPRRQVLLLAVAVGLPAALLVFLSARTVMQDRELVQKRLADRRLQLIDAVARALLDRLERIKLEEATALVASRAPGGTDRLAQGATVFVAEIDSAGVQMAWSSDPYALRATRVLVAPDFLRLIERGTHAEFVDGLYDTATVAYKMALAQATDPAQAAYAELLLGRALRSARSPKASASYRHLLRAPVTVRDEQGIPFALYAANVLSMDYSADQEVAAALDRIRGELLPSRFLSLPACHAIAGASAVAGIRERCDDLERARSMAADASVLTALRAGGTRWIVGDSGRWLAGIAPATTAHPSILLAVHVDSLAEAVASLSASDLRLVASIEPETHAIGHGIQGLGVRWLSPESEAWGSGFTSAFSIAVLAFILGVVLLGGLFLWRDIRRELRLAHLRSQFVASVSHELRTPLTSIRIFAETLRDRANVDPKARHEYLETIARESDRLTRLLQNVLDFSRVERSEREYQLLPQQLRIIVERALGTMRFPLEQQGFTVAFACDEDFVSVRCDADAVEQAVLNLLSNAIKYSGTSRRIDVRLERRSDVVAVVVRDYGIGIAAAHQPRLFDRFYRAPTAENDVIPGTGLGLTLVHHTAEGHGGTIKVESEPGHGTTVTLCLRAGVPSGATIERRAAVPSQVVTQP